MENKPGNIPPKPSAVRPRTTPVAKPVAKPGVKPMAKPVSKPAPKAPKPKSERKGDPAKVFLVILVLLLAGGVAYLLYDKFNQQKVVAEDAQKSKEAHKTDIDLKVAEINRLEDSIKVVIAEKEALGQELAEERAKLAELEDLKSKLQHHEVSINSLNRRLSKYKKEYEVVTASVESLSEENKQLAAEKETLHAKLKQKDDSIQALHKEKQALTDKIVSASGIKVENIDVKVINTVGKELPKAENYKAMLVLKVRMYLNIAENKLLNGKKDIYLRFIDPSGTAAITGEKIFIADGKKTFYTDKQTIDFDQSKSISFTYNKGSRFRPGKYMIEFYADGKKIGDSHLTLIK